MISVKEYKIKANSNKNIVFLSDIHYYSNKNEKLLNNIVKKIELINPDYICIGGDFIDIPYIKDEEVLISFFYNLSIISKVFISLGNHDITDRYLKKECYNNSLFNKISSLNNVYILDNDIYSEDNISFIGHNIGFSKDYDSVSNIDNYLTKLNNIKLLDSNYNILISHSPILITNKILLSKNTKKIDLVLCGHIHGGMTVWPLNKILKNRVFIMPNKKSFFKKYCYGHFIIDNINYIVTSGITKLSYVSHLSFFNFLFNSELIIVKLSK